MDNRGLEEHACFMQVAHRHAFGYQHEVRVLGGLLHARPQDQSARAHASTDGDQRLGLKDAQCLAQGRPGYAEERQELAFRQQHRARLDLAGHDLLPQTRRHQMGQLWQPKLVRDRSQMLQSFRLRLSVLGHRSSLVCHLSVSGQLR
jgi:hypothetical protein